ncbi:hypothetical protein F383_16855 [Gossypium arboreum]|uniref:Uncharacterized protein n=1 Tax=Gossypium arboreum TaxID=29729 RepID=A0A0B0MJB1_GOSAR|nr:hypothetical protein F383_16855 [Gossypium arboreum]
MGMWNSGTSCVIHTPKTNLGCVVLHGQAT